MTVFSEQGVSLHSDGTPLALFLDYRQIIKNEVQSIMMRKEEKLEVIQQNATHEGDTGSPEVQIAILTKRINDLQEHFKEHKSAAGATCSTT